MGLPRERGFAELFRIEQGKAGAGELVSGSLSFAPMGRLSQGLSPESTLDGEETRHREVLTTRIAAQGLVTTGAKFQLVRVRVVSTHIEYK